MELVPTIFASFKITKDISRTEKKDKRFLFIKYRLKEKQRNLSLRLNIGLLNASLRNGYVYAGQSITQALNLELNPEYENGVPPDIAVLINWNHLATDEILERAILELQ